MKFSQIAAVGTAALLSVPAMGQNLLLNPSFEDNGPGFEPFDVWMAFTNGVADDNTDIAAVDGTRSLKTFSGFFGPGIQSDSGAFQVVTGITPGNEYTLSGFVHVPSFDPLAPVDFDDLDGNGSFGHIVVLTVEFFASGDATAFPAVPPLGAAAIDPAYAIGTDPLDTWLPVTTSGIAPANATEAKVTCVLVSFGDDTGAAFFDDISLTDDGPPNQGGMGCNAADIDQDGDNDPDDIALFVELFIIGCD